MSPAIKLVSLIRQRHARHPLDSYRLNQGEAAKLIEEHAASAVFRSRLQMRRFLTEASKADLRPTEE